VQQKEGKGVHGTVSCTTHVSSAGLLSVNTFISHVSMCYWFCSLSLLELSLVGIHVSAGVGRGLLLFLFIFLGGRGHLSICVCVMMVDEEFAPYQDD